MSMSFDSELDHWLQARKAERAHKLEQSFEKLSAPGLRWLAIAPAWTRDLAQAAGFPAQGDIATFFESAADQGLCTKTLLSPVPQMDVTEGQLKPVQPVEMYATPTATAQEIIARQMTAAPALSTEVAGVGQAVLNAVNNGTKVPAAIRTWAELARRADDDPGGFLLDRVDDTLKTLDFAGAARWIEAATPLERLLQGTLREGVHLASLRYQLRQQQLDIEKQLEQFVVRPEQIAAVDELLDGSVETWALHYAGAGGMGKTMLLRYLRAKVIPQRQASSAHVDFDYLKPEYPSTKPALLLLQFAENLRLYDREGVASSYFESFATKALTFHEGIVASAQPRSPVELIRDVEFQLLLDTFASAARHLPQPVVLILDTCEELSKMLSDGSVPDNVTATFEVLEGVHRRLPSVRVVFSGRRPLAVSGAGGWQAVSPTVGGVERNYLRVHEIRGFTRGTAEEFLERKAQAPKHLIAAVLDRCPERAYVPQFRWPHRTVVEVEPRFSPYELSLYASWIAADSGLTEATIRANSFDQYIKTRIVGRLRGEAMLKLLPALTWLRRFDDSAVLALAGLESNSAEGQALVAEVLRQEWIDRQYGECLEIERGLQSLLFDYYVANEPLLLEQGRVACADYLESISRSTPLHLLDLSHFEALVRALEPEPERAARWWMNVESKVLDSNGYSLILPITRRLLAAEFWPAEPVADVKRIVAAIAATQAAAQLHTGNVHDLKSTWLLVEREAERHPFPETARHLKTLVLGWQGRYEEIDQDELCENSVAALLGFIERDLGWSLIVTEKSAATPASIADIAKSMAESAVSIELRAFALLMRGYALSQQGARSGNVYREALMMTAEFADTPKLWLHWVSPEDPKCRLRLEFILHTYPAQRSPAELQWLFDMPWPDNIDADRLGTAHLAILTAQAPAAIRRTREIHAQSAARAFDFHPVVVAHVAFPPLFIALAEEEARVGHVMQSLDMLASSRRSFEAAASYFGELIEADRAQARIIRKFRLRDGRFPIPDSILTSDAAEDLHLRLAIAALSADESISSLHMQASHGSPAVDAAVRHSIFSTTRFPDLDEREDRIAATYELLRQSADNETFAGISCRLDICEIAELLANSTIEIQRPPKFHAVRWWNEYPELAAEALTLALRSMALQNSAPPPRMLVERIGKRRAATIALEEGELLALRLPEKAVSLFRFASRNFASCHDWLQAMIADACQALAHAQLGNLVAMEKALRAVRTAFFRNPGTTMLVEEDLLRPDRWSSIESTIAGTSPVPLQDSSSWMQPWRFRIAACLAYQADGTQSNEVRQRVAKLWRSQLSELPPEVSGWLERDGQAQVPARDVTSSRGVTFMPSFEALPPGSATVDRRYTVRGQRTRSSGSLFETNVIHVHPGPGAGIHVMPPDTAYERLQQEFSNYFLAAPAEQLTFDVDRASAWICWEAIIDAAAPGSFVRRTCGSHRRPAQRPAERVEMHTLTGNHLGADFAGSSRPQLDWRYAYTIESLAAGMSSSTTNILHVIGDPLETRAGLRMVLMNESQESRRDQGRLISADEISRLPSIGAVLLQCPIRRQTTRSGVDREKASYLRSFAAELHQEVPVVITLPAMSFEDGVPVLSCFSNAVHPSADLEHAMRNAARMACDLLRPPRFDEERFDISFYGAEP